MKRIFLFCLLAILAKVGLSQHAITQATYNDDIRKTIIKEYDFPATISYVETKRNHYFAYADQTMQVINCEIEPKYTFWILQYILTKCFSAV